MRGGLAKSRAAVARPGAVAASPGPRFSWRTATCAPPLLAHGASLEEATWPRQSPPWHEAPRGE
eukprot:9792332-Alexandrium_andersonii.AAC.1